ncbi:hypothetical protein [Hyphomicrobium sp. CS1GBMeth3]|uniref:hypothetical protein n=1 Tax=Hyphomicrobium sp. CS1GBMeth3 TaxID=1892845 RepID=UPI000B2E8CCC|nr:hypothetical protein [Hyphomicrobium sp. CS1GBMeth3]
MIKVRTAALAAVFLATSGFIGTAVSIPLVCGAQTRAEDSLALSSPTFKEGEPIGNEHF